MSALPGGQSQNNYAFINNTLAGKNSKQTFGNKTRLINGSGGRSRGLDNLASWGIVAKNNGGEHVRQLEKLL